MMQRGPSFPEAARDRFVSIIDVRVLLSGLTLALALSVSCRLCCIATMRSQLFAVVGALGTNYYTSKNDNEVTEVLKGVGQLAINFYNLALSLDAKYDLVDKAKDAGASAVEKVKEKDEKGIVSKVEDVVVTATSKFGELSDEYDLPTKAKEVIAAADSLSIKAIDGAGEINEKYALTDKALDAVKSTANKAAEKAKEARS